MTTDQTPALRDQQDTAQAGPVVWILQTGEDYEGGHIIGVYLERDLAQADFLKRAQEIGATFGVDDIRPTEDGSLHLHGGCDWLSLEPHTVTTARELTT